MKPGASTFPPGGAVEVSSADEGFRGSYYSATVVSYTPKSSKYVVSFDKLFQDESGTRPVTEEVEPSQLRPLPPAELSKDEGDFEEGEKVEASWNDGWWVGEVVKCMGKGRYKVGFGEKEKRVFKKGKVRRHWEWVDGSWVDSLGRNQKSPLLMKKQSSDGMGSDELRDGVIVEVSSDNVIKEGTLVEVSSDEDGLNGAWFSGVVVEVLSEGKYLVEYSSLRADDDQMFLREEIDALHIRPNPPKIAVSGRFKVLDEVDAFFNDGWWVGIIAKLLEDSKYIVYFRGSEEELEFKHSDLRKHQEWINGKWFSSSLSI
ncbi:hypothetical protein MLD38_020711 [Melastoma candidum]|uniref:Uncharacterized protein n=1 Tax=Melastoma candidum TaxID=119954 RepID=A0ACB9QE22_9MYRT|nr:hypothetical protein MLD38_020711 [Melastoma candidum]